MAVYDIPTVVCPVCGVRLTWVGCPPEQITDGMTGSCSLCNHNLLFVPDGIVHDPDCGCGGVALDIH